MASQRSQTTDKAASPSQSPVNVEDDIDTETGVTQSDQTGLDTDTSGTLLVPDFGIAGAFAAIDDALFVPAGNDIGAASQFAPGAWGAVGYQNEAHAREGVITESNLGNATRPTGQTDDVKTAMGLA